MKKLFLVSILLLFSCSLFAKQNEDLDLSILKVSENIVSSMAPNSIIAILDFSAEKRELGTYISEQIAEDVMNIGGLRLVTRHHTDLVLQELKYQMSGYVSDESALSICQQLGAQALVFGSIEEFDNNYRLQIKMIDVGTGAFIILKNINISRSQKINRLLGRASKYYKASVGALAEGNLYSLNSMAIAGGLTFDYAISRNICLGLESRLSFDVSKKDLKIFTIEPLAFIKVYLVSPSGEPSSGLFVEAQGGAALVNIQNDIKTSFVVTGALGYRWGINNFYVEPMIRFGYPVIVGAGATVGVRF